MRGAAAAVLLWSTAAHADQPRGTYTLDRGGWKSGTNADGVPYPSCGGTKLYNGLATFVIEYGDTIRVNGREWRLHTHAGLPGSPDAHDIIRDPAGTEQIWIWFRTDGSNATGYLSLIVRRDGKLCVDAWELRGKFTR